jgi:hypothetical protein
LPSPLPERRGACTAFGIDAELSGSDWARPAATPQPYKCVRPASPRVVSWNTRFKPTRSQRAYFFGRKIEPFRSNPPVSQRAAELGTALALQLSSRERGHAARSLCGTGSTVVCQAVMSTVYRANGGLSSCGVFTAAAVHPAGLSMPAVEPANGSLQRLNRLGLVRDPAAAVHESSSRATGHVSSSHATGHESSSRATADSSRRVRQRHPSCTGPRRRLASCRSSVNTRVSRISLSFDRLGKVRCRTPRTTHGPDVQPAPVC